MATKPKPKPPEKAEKTKGKDTTPADAVSWQEEATDAPRAEKAEKGKAAKKYTFRVLAGEHNEGGKTYTKGQVFQSPHPLDEVFMEKFERLGGATARGRDFGPGFEGTSPIDQQVDVSQRKGQNTLTRDVDEEEEVEEPEAEADADDEAEADADRGDDVTDEFDGAKEAALTVFKKGRTYTVYDADDGGQVDAGELASKAEVKKFVEQYGT